MNMKERMHKKQLYFCDDKDLVEEQAQVLETLYDFNATRPREVEKRQELLKKLFAEFGAEGYVEPPLHTNWGRHTHIGKHFYANFNLTLVDDTYIYIGDHVMIGPNVSIVTASHPVEPELRRKAAEFNVPVHIGNNVWIGAHAVILPGITIGDNSVIGAGSIVTKDVPANVVVVGNPAHILREINDHDREYYYKDLKIDL